MTLTARSGRSFLRRRANRQCAVMAQALQNSFVIAWLPSTPSGDAISASGTLLLAGLTGGIKEISDEVDTPGLS